MPMASTTQLQSNRLTIASLLAITTGIAFAITCGRAIEHLRFPADSWYYGVEAVPRFDVVGILVTALYGLGVSVCFLALRSGNVWKSPGKVLSIIIAFMCVMNWGLDAFASSIVSYRLGLETPLEFVPTRGAADPRGNVFGIWYRAFPGTIGYFAALPLLVFILFKTASTQSVAWRLVWLGFLVFSAMLCVEIVWHVTTNVAMPIADWYFEIALTFPSVLIVAAFVVSWTKDQLDWWTVALSLPGPLIWFLMIAVKLIAKA